MTLSVERILRKARRLAGQGETDLAVQEFQRILDKYPNNRLARQGLKELQKPMPEMGINSSGPAQQQIESLVSLFNQGRLQETLTQGEALAAQFPETPFLMNLLGSASMAMGRAEEAESYFNNALQLKPDYALAYKNKAKVLAVLARHEEAIACYEKSLKLGPDDAFSRNHMGNILSMLGKHGEAADNYRKALALKPDFAEAHRNISEAIRYQAGDAHIQQMLELIHRPDLGDKEQALLNFALGKAHDDIGDYEKAMAYFAEGNRVVKSKTNYDISADRDSFGRLKASFNKDSPAPIAADANTEASGRQLVFIVGMPRSGTTLVEQIVVSHSQVFGAGEIGLLGQAISASESEPAGNPKRQLISIREKYLSGIAELDDACPMITDKMPYNFLWIGFIVAALPEAKIIHVTRDARATCWSMYRNFFSAEGSNYSFDLEDVANYYNLYLDLMAYWHDLYPGKIYDLSYESLTDQQEEQTRSLLEYLGLNFEEQCLNFHETRRAVQTASAGQVRQKMYQGSSEKWQNYAEHLRSMLKILN